MNNKIIRLIVVLIILLDISLFYLIKQSNSISSYMNNYQKMLLVIVVLVPLAVMFISGKIFKYKFIFGKEVLIFILIYIFEIFNSAYKYPQKTIDVIIISNFIFIILAYFIFTYYLKKTGEYKKFQFLIIYICTILSLLFIIQSLSIDRGIKFLNVSIDRYRFGTLRIYESGYIINAASILALTNTIDKNNTKIRRISSFISFIICFLEILLVQKGRVGLISQIVVLLICLIIFYKNNLVKMIFISIFIGIGMYFLLTSPIMSDYADSVSYDDISYTTRILENDFYVNQIKENPILGMGFINSNKNYRLTYFLMGPDGNYYRNDVGMTGYVNTYGFIGLIWYIVLFVKIFIIILKLYLNNKIRNNKLIEIIGLYCFIMLNSTTNVIFEPQRILTLPIMLSMIDYLYSSKRIQMHIKKYY